MTLELRPEDLRAAAESADSWPEEMGSAWYYPIDDDDEYGQVEIAIQHLREGRDVCG